MWKCKSDEFQGVVDVRNVIYYFMINDIKLYNINYIDQNSVKAYPNRGECLVKFKQDTSEWIRGRIETLLSWD